LNSLIRNIAIFAHVDAGKTSLTEQLLFHSGKIRSLGSVDKGNTQTDNLEIERQRSITITSSILSFEWENYKINLIDTPGHIDFSSETQKAFLAIDAAILIISAVEGIQAQTEKLINLLLIKKKPFIVFINKIDRMGADSNAIIQELNNELHLETFQMQSIHDEGSNEVSTSKVWDQDIFSINTSLIEKIVEYNEKLLNQYFLEEELDFKILDDELIKLSQNQKLIPIFLGSAKFDKGIDSLLHGITHYLPKPKIKDSDLLGIIFKTYYQKDGKWSAIRLFSGNIKTRTQLYNASQEIVEKINLIKCIDLNKQQIIEEVVAGDIALIKGLTQTIPGDFVGKLPKDELQTNLSKPLLSVQVLPNLNDVNKLIEALSILNNEDPDLEFKFIKEEREFHIKIHGEIQKEIIQSILKSRFNIEVSLSNPTIIYKETPTVIAEGYVRYWMPKPCWAIMKFKIEPLKTGGGIVFNSVVGVNKIKKQYQKDVQKTIPYALQQGILGWEVDDIRITLIDGEDHEMHTKSNDFSIATPMGILDGLNKAKMTLLEPILSFKIKTPNDFIGKINSELINLRAAIKSSEISTNNIIIQGEIPLATSLDFPIKLSIITGGKAKLSTQFLKYQKCDINLGKTRKYKGISPLDTAKYILKARKALS
jgi:ribosomal protection tetracycline resistance protein